MLEIKDAKLYTMPEICEITGLERHSIMRHIKSGKLKAIPRTKDDHYRVFGKFLKEYLGL